MRLASESRSTQATAQQLGISPKLLYRWQQAQLVAEVSSAEQCVLRLAAAASTRPGASLASSC